ncbi:MAG TPA: AAA family ATPase [Chitinophagales bacterium]|nr:AAA family ATPase [Chitinophagales bacterium]
MLIDKVVLKNFRQYYGENEIVFSTDKDKNVTIIRGENGVGKTAMLNSIKWAFFETLTENFRNEKDLINHTAVKKGIKSCSVEVDFTEDNQSFHLLRRFDSTSKRSELKIFRIEDGVYSASLPEPELVINSMLPKEMGEYFFFQGEGSNAVTTGSASGNLAQSIRDILGFKVANKLTESLERMLRENRRLISNHDTSGESARINNELEELEKNRAFITKSLVTLNEKIPELENELRDVEHKLQKLDNHDLARLRKEESEVSHAISRKKRELEDLKQRKYSLIGKYGWAVFGSKLANKSQDFIDDSELKGRLPEPYNKTFIEDILSQQKCICGACLSSESDGYKNIVGLLSKAANPQLMQRLSGIRAQINSINTLYDGAADEINNTNRDFDNTAEELELLTLRLENINAQILEIPEQEIKDLQRIKNNLQNELKRDYQDNGVYQGRLEDLNKKCESLERELTKLQGSTSIIRDLQIKERFITELKEYLSGYLDKTELSVRDFILLEVNKTLAKFSRHDFKIKVDGKDFKFYLLDKEDRPVGQGDGLNLLLNLTLTASLIKFASQRKHVRDPLLSSATVAPLVIDAPFGVLDNKYRNVVVELLPEYANQIVFLVSSSQWTEEMDEKIRSRIGKEYALILEETSPQGQREVDTIMSGNREYIVSRYDCEVDRTIIQEITI